MIFTVREKVIIVNIICLLHKQGLYRYVVLLEVVEM